LHILDGTGQVLLNPHSPKTSPSRPIEAVPGAFSEGSFHQVLSGFDVIPCIGGMTYRAHPVKHILAEMTLDRSAGFVFRALLSERTRCAYFFGCSVIPALPVYMQ
jgi:hypothetical protein